MMPAALAAILPADFHLLRPLWMLAMVPALLLCGLLWHRMGKGRSAWIGLVDAHLLRALALKDRGSAKRWPVPLLFLAVALASIAMAGPTWQKLPQPASDRIDPTVVVLSLAQSMNATDQSPNRITAARHKVADILNRMRGGQVALVIFADAPFVAAPLTEDARVVEQMLPEIATDLMPVMDNRPDAAIRQAVELLKNTGSPTGRIVLLTDGLGDRPEQTRAAAATAAAAGYSVNVIGLGGETPVPLLAFDGRKLDGRDGTVLTTSLDAAGLRDLAAAGHGRFTPLTAGDRDLDTIFADALPGTARTNPQDAGLSADQWVDMGPWLVLVLAIALAPLAFRRGWIAALLLAVLATGGAPRDARAQDSTAPPFEQRWRDLWQTPDQQGASAFDRKDYSGAAQSFQNPDWQATSLYKNGEYEKAAEAFGRLPNGAYNQANALARAGKLDDAIKAYDKALKSDPDNADALYNRALTQKQIDAKNKPDLPQPPPQQGGGGGGSDQNKQDQAKQDQQNQKNQKNQPDKQDQKQDSAQNKPQDQGNTPKDQKPQGDDQAKSKPDPKEQGQNKDPGKDQPQNQPKPGDTDPARPDPKNAGNQPAKPDPQKPEPAPQPQPMQAQPAQPGGDKPGAEKDEDKQDLAALPLGQRPLTADEQNREQALRMVPDDPMGLLRARIRAHYAGRPVPVQGTDAP
ncbi:hypothetical protein GCM10007301_11070 [Azorhizobium oxalatiphilum]|uniref:VWFA domain-containing protein n=1 Tax=Azorhizobium oxalatiphilum TaxID=980631 RepID=A0A917F8J3_9HYPH|nr:VWA domain-containing protein [Azorhizobium oxalatiphilum]GGF53410.1 hypothetical protein GCM10007301_11070 [Azorhizobium oxalatiphilum]